MICCEAGLEAGLKGKMTQDLLCPYFFTVPRNPVPMQILDVSLCGRSISLNCPWVFGRIPTIISPFASGKMHLAMAQRARALLSQQKHTTSYSVASTEEKGQQGCMAKARLHGAQLTRAVPPASRQGSCDNKAASGRRIEWHGGHGGLQLRAQATSHNAGAGRHGNCLCVQTFVKLWSFSWPTLYYSFLSICTGHVIIIKFLWDFGLLVFYFFHRYTLTQSPQLTRPGGRQFDAMSKRSREESRGRDAKMANLSTPAAWTAQRNPLKKSETEQIRAKNVGNSIQCLRFEE